MNAAIFLHIATIFNHNTTPIATDGSTRAYVYNLICSLMAVVGGLLGYAMLERGLQWIPYVLVFASSGFIYIAVSDLMPQMQRRATIRETIPQVVLVALGVALVLALTRH